MAEADKKAREAARAANKAKKDAPVQKNTMLNYSVSKKVRSSFDVDTETLRPIATVQ